MICELEEEYKGDMIRVDKLIEFFFKRILGMG